MRVSVQRVTGVVADHPSHLPGRGFAVVAFGSRPHEDGYGRYAFHGPQ